MASKRVQAYEYWGVNFIGQTGEEHYAICPFCNNADSDDPSNPRFYVNEKTGAFICHRGSCAVSGTFGYFLELTYQKYLATTTEADRKIFNEWTNIPLPVCDSIAWDGFKFIYPLVNEHNEVVDLRSYRRGKKEHSTSGCSPCLGNLPKLLETNEKVFIVPGFRNQLILEWLFWRTGQSYIVVSTPGENTFRNEWGQFFDRKDIVICYDHDEAGYGILDQTTGKATGSRKVEAVLRNYAKSVSFITWPEDKKKGYDVRDFVTDGKGNPYKCCQLFQSLITTTHKYEQETKKARRVDKRIVTAADILAKSKELYRLDQGTENGFKISLATALSINIPGNDNVWIYLRGAPGSGKTITCEMLEGSDRCVWESNLTKKALVSGWGANDARITDPSILSKVNNKCLVIKDLTQLLSQLESEIKAVFGILRNAYDGRHREPFGNGIRQYLCRFSFIAAVTNEIKRIQTASLGERFLHYEYNNTLPEEEIQEQALNSAIGGSDSRMELKSMVADFLDTDWDFSPAAVLGRVPRWFRDRIKPLARLIALLRTPVIRYEHGRMMTGLVYRPSVEHGTRAAIQLEKLAVALTYVDQKLVIDEEIYEIIKKVAQDTVDSFGAEIVRSMIGKDSLSRDEITAQTGIKQSQAYLQDLLELNIVETNGSASHFQLTKKINDLWHRAKL